MAPVDGSNLRFAVGDRVSCNMGSDGWASGKVVALHYREDHWPAKKTAPYQVELDPAFGSALIFAPMDIPKVIRAEMPSTFSLPEDGRDAAEVLAALKTEVAKLQDDPIVLTVSGPELMAVAEDGTELFVPKDAGPWVITMVVQGPTTSAYSSHLRMQLKVNTAWPKSPAEVRVHSWIHSPFVKQNGVMDEAAMAEALGTLDADVSPLCRTVRAAFSLLNNPSQFCEDDTDSADDAAESNKERLDVILKYKVQREHDWLFDPKRAYSTETIHPEYWKAYCLNTPEAWAALVTTEATEVYSVPLFKPELCKAFVEELDKFHGTGLPARRPNSMNNYGIVVNEIGMEPALDQLCHNLLQPLAHYLFPGVGSHFDRHHTFVVRYKVGEDLGLDMHTDDSDVTFNVCLGKDFKGAGLQFCGDQGATDHRKASLQYQHRVGHCVVHRGHRRHGADDITEGERLNLIVWTRNIEYRRSRLWSKFNIQSRSSSYKRESEPPDLVCLSFTHDRDYGVFKEYKGDKKRHRGKGWCPPIHAEYEGFMEEESVD